jgi:hypothetical protein
LTWDTLQRGLVLRVQPTGHKAFKVIYRFGGRPRWVHLGSADSIDLTAARRLAGKVMLEVAEGQDPAAERRAARTRGTFQELAKLYVERHAKKRNKSWKQADRLVKKYLLTRWGKLQADAISRVDVRTMMSSIDAPVLANQVLAAASAIFSWVSNATPPPTANACCPTPRFQNSGKPSTAPDCFAAAHSS